LSAESGAAELGSDTAAAAATSPDTAMPGQGSVSATAAAHTPAGTSEDDVMSATSSGGRVAKQAKLSAAAADESEEEEEEADGGVVGVEQQLQQMALQPPTGKSGVTEFTIACLLRWCAYWLGYSCPWVSL